MSMHQTANDQVIGIVFRPEARVWICKQTYGMGRLKLGPMYADGSGEGKVN
jgi:hypothetical protein